MPTRSVFNCGSKAVNPQATEIGAPGTWMMHPAWSWPDATRAPVIPERSVPEVRRELQRFSARPGVAIRVDVVGGDEGHFPSGPYRSRKQLAHPLLRMQRPGDDLRVEAVGMPPTCQVIARCAEIK